MNRRLRFRHRARAGPRARYGLRALVVLATVCLALAASAQVLGIGKGFKAAEYFPPPSQSQMQSLLEAERVQPLPKNRFLLSQLKLRTFSTNGQPGLLIEAPQCYYDRQAKTAESPGHLNVLSVDGKFRIEGEGFFFAQTTSTLVISNQVRTYIDSDVLKTVSDKPAPAAEKKEKNPPIEIQSVRFRYSADSGEGLYEEQVEARATNGISLKSGKLAFKVPMKERQLQSIRADEDVLVDYDQVHAQGQTATYSADSGIVQMSGEPKWRREQSEGRGDLLTIDRTNKIFRADGHAWVRMPAQNLSLASLMSQTNGTGTKPRSGTNQFVEISSGYHEFRTNRADFGQAVRVKELLDGQPRGSMACEQLAVRYSGTNQLDTLEARGDVLLQEGTNTLSGGLAEFNGTNGMLVVTEKPAWQSGPRSGSGQVIQVNTRTNEMVVKGNARMRLPAQELARAAGPAGVEGKKKPVLSATNEFAEVFSGEYSIRPQRLEFRGGVYATHPQMNWACETLSVDFAEHGGQVEGMHANKGVAFDLRDDKGQKVHGIGEQAVYTYRVSGGVTNDLLELLGNPAVLQTAARTNVSPHIIYDRGKNTLRNEGSYSITSEVKGVDTNALELPKARRPK